MRAFTFGIHFINTIRRCGRRSGTSEARNAILHHNGELLLQLCYNIYELFIFCTIACDYFKSASIYSYYLYSVLLLGLFQLLFLQIVYYLYYCCDDFDN